MKQCTKCGTTQKNSNTRCVNCDAVLGAPLTKDEEEALSYEISQTITELANTTDPFYVSPLRRIIGMISVVMIALCVLWFMIFNITGDNRDYILGALVAIIFFIVPAFELLFPETAWKLSRLGDTWKYGIELSPSDMWVSFSRGLSYFFFGAGWLAVAFAIIRLLDYI